MRRPSPAVLGSVALHLGVAALAFTSINGVSAFAELSDRRDLPTFCVGDATADAARELGVSVPDEVSVSGFDDLAEAQNSEDGGSRAPRPRRGGHRGEPRRRRLEPSLPPIGHGGHGQPGARVERGRYVLT